MIAAPKEIRKQSTGLEILWSDHSKTFSQYEQIRKSCSCAICKEMKTPLTKDLPFYQRSVSPQSMQLIGNYALELLWMDGHRSIVSYDRLKTYEA